MTISVGDLIVLLRNCDPDALIEFDFPARPTTVASWRGVYAEPALGHSAMPDVQPTVRDLYDELKNAIDGRTFCGWKGGDYSYTATDTLHVANPGDVGHLVVSGIADCDHYVVIKTQFQKAW
ncbi:hypothetical protein KNJ79_05195 [Sphingopyxis indica]|uniref:hypothetical protein n=1 Tax=Sphingopyxis indica TaxID=436663 RepID=UPI002938CF79|nr:hypothetical protein [Sphingopyxis indica]WOF44328.1 hypothetical protein KNJ79_05195 [Sphingopyxis indica]